MNTLETALTFGGLCASVLGIILAMIFNHFEKVIGECISIAIICVGILSIVIGFSIYNFNTLEYEHNEIAITITNKSSRSYRSGKYNLRHDYYFYFDDHRIKVDHTTYNKYDIGDTILITETIAYRLDRETGERTLENVTYNE